MPQTNINKIITNPLVLAILPVLGTCCALAYEQGYLSYFGLPTNFIQLDIEQILSAALAIVVSIALISFYYFFIAKLLAFLRSKHILLRVVADALKTPTFAFPLVFLMIPVSSEIDIWMMLGLLVLSFFILIAVDLLAPFFDEDKTLPYWQRLEFSMKKTEITDSSSEKTPKMMEFVVATLVIFIPMIALFSLFGSWYASNQRGFWALKKDPSVLLIKTYGERSIFVRYNESEHKIINEVVVIKLSDSEPLQLVWKETGQLSIENEKNPSLKKEGVLFIH